MQNKREYISKDRFGKDEMCRECLPNSIYIFKNMRIFKCEC